MVGRQLTDFGPGERAVIGEGRKPDFCILGGMLKARSEGLCSPVEAVLEGLHRGRLPRPVILSVKLSIIGCKRIKLPLD